MLSRETIIALRARHTGFRIALEILHPQQPAAAPPEPPSPSATDDALPVIDLLAQFKAWEAQQRRERRDKIMRLLAVLLLTAALVVGAWNWPRKSSPRTSQPPPEGRAILPAQP